MTDKKKQHFVPQFYLRNFASDSSGRSIGIYNVDSHTYIESGPIKSQSYENYFYGKDGKLEKEFEILESTASKIIQRVITKKYLPYRQSMEHYKLLYFIVSLEHRTVRHVEHFNKLLDIQMKAIFKDHPVIKDHLDEFQMKWTNPVDVSISMVNDMIDGIMDMDYVLLSNGTSVPFVTSDHPVVKYNQFLEEREKHGGITGWGQKGLQFFIPLAPSVGLLFYDEWAYTPDTDCVTKDVLVTNVEDVNSLNQLQVLHLNENVYFGAGVSESQVRELCDLSFQKGKKAEPMTAEYFERGGHGKLIHFFQRGIKIGMKLSFLAETPSAVSYEMGTKVAHVRDEKRWKRD